MQRKETMESLVKRTVGRKVVEEKLERKHNQMISYESWLDVDDEWR